VGVVNRQQSMFFLIEYDRSSGQLVTLQTFDSSKRQRATDSQLTVELRLHRSGIDREVVLLEAASEGAIRLTHARYFEGLQQLASKLKTRLLLT